jgi:hypothetical protein
LLGGQNDTLVDIEASVAISPTHDQQGLLGLALKFAR